MEPNNCDLYGYEKEKKQLIQMIDAVFLKNESHSVIIYGDRGFGKHTLVNECLRYLNIDSSLIIRLNGFVHNSDINALNAIGRQLNIQISSASQIGNDLKKILKSTKEKRVFILTEFDLFCRRQQNLLYNILDTINYVQGIMVIGLTTRTDCIELLEKRVKSRLKLRSLVLVSPFADFKDYCTYAHNLIDRKITMSNLKPLLEIQYQKSKSIRDLKRVLLQLLLENETFKDINQRKMVNSKVAQLMSLSNFELSVILLAFKKVKNSLDSSFKLGHLYQYLNEIPKQIIFSKSLFIQSVHHLIDYGLIIIKPGHSLHSYLTDSTPLLLNVDECQITETLKKKEKEGKLPTGFRKLLTIQQ